MTTGMIRKIALVIMIISILVSSALFYFAGQMELALTIISCIVAVIGWEIYSVWKHGKTMSSESKYAIEESFKDRLVIYAALSCFLVASVAFAVHIGTV